MTIVLDIETSPLQAYVWGVWKQNVGHDQLLSRSYIMCACVKVLGEAQTYYYETRTEDDSSVVKKLLDWIDKADFVIAHNGKKFDMPIIKARALVNKLSPPSPYKLIDTLIIAKREFRFTRNTLQNLAEELGCTPKLTHPRFTGFVLWSECLKGNEEAWEEMKFYNIQDVLTLEEVYNKLRPWDSQHPTIPVIDDYLVTRCPKCGSSHINHRGYRTTNVGKYKRFVCKDCGGWSSERYTANTIEKRKSLLKSI